MNKEISFFFFCILLKINCIFFPKNNYHWNCLGEAVLFGFTILADALILEERDKLFLSSLGEVGFVGFLVLYLGLIPRPFCCRYGGIGIEGGFGANSFSLFKSLGTLL